MSREWENWDSPGVADNIQAWWKNTEFETEHRALLADLVLEYCSSPQTSVLDVGCGTGLVYQQLTAKPGHAIDYTGVDISLEMLRKAREGFPRGRFLYGDGYNLVFRDAEVDVVLCFEVLGHIGHIEPMVRELLRVAKTTCIFTVWPAKGDAIVERREPIEGVEFLHREFPDQYVRDVIAATGRVAERVKSVTAKRLNFGHVAYIVSMNPLA